MMLSDSFFQQGATHEVCEDYALHGEGHVVLSDGCSNGGGPSLETDWGARLMCKAGQQHIDLLRHKNWHLFNVWVGGQCQRVLDAYPNVNPDCVTATLVAALRLEKSVFTYMVGDGVWGGKRRDGTWEIHLHEYVRGGSRDAAAPYYLKYGWREGEQQKYFDLFGGKVKRTIWTGNLMDPQTTMLANAEEIQLTPEQPFFWREFMLSDYEFVFVATDGVTSFYENVQTETSKHTEPVHVLDVLRVLLDVHSSNPGFLRRQRQWAWKRNVAGTLLRRNWHNADDVSLGAVVCGGP